MKALVGAFYQEKVLVGAFSVIVQLHRLIDLRHYCQVASGTPVEAAYSDGLGGELQKLERMFRVKQSRGSRSPSEFEGSGADPDSLR